MLFLDVSLKENLICIGLVVFVIREFERNGRIPNNFYKIRSNVNTNNFNFLSLDTSLLFDKQGNYFSMESNIFKVNLEFKKCCWDNRTI